jgi:hypothetical protein
MNVLVIFIPVTKYLRKQFKRGKDLFWLMFSGFSSGQLAPLLWIYDEAEHQGSMKAWKCKDAHLTASQEAKRGERRERGGETERQRQKEAKDKVYTTKAQPQSLFPPPRPHHLIA